MRPLALSLLVAVLGGCNLFDPTGTPQGGGGGATGASGGATGFGRATVEVTVGGVHYGPSAPAAGGSASLVDSRDANGEVTLSTFRASAATSDGAAGCTVAVQRSGQGVTPIGAGAGYILQSSGEAGATPDGAVEPVEGESATAPSGAFTCSGAACNGVGLSLSYLGADHVEGWLSGTLPSTSGAGAADVVCSFWLPLGAYAP
jgi:hypothetical protein